MDDALTPAKCLKMDCAEVLCDLYCENGFATDENVRGPELCVLRAHLTQSRDPARDVAFNSKANLYMEYDSLADRDDLSGRQRHPAGFQLPIHLKQQAITCG